MKRCALRLALVLSLAASGAWAKDYDDLSLAYSYETASEPLTTDLIAQLDPGQPNPQLRRWLLARKVEVKGLSSRQISKKSIGVKATTIDADSEAYLRPPGPWYQTIEEFPCADQKQGATRGLFETTDGAARGAAQASKLWEQILNDRKLRLTVALSRVAGPDRQAVWEKAQRVFQEWLNQADREWRAKVATELSAEQWKNYVALARARHVCVGSGKKAGEPNPERWMSRDPVAVVPTQPLVHAPSRRWQGSFAVRMDIRIGDNSLNGQFLVDPSANRSLVSPDWLVEQGAQPVWFEIPEAIPEHVRVGAGPGLSGLGKPAQVPEAVLSGYSLSMNRFDIFKTDIFDEPESPAPCCSGVLGRDFLGRYVVEFSPDKPRELEIWPLEHFSAPDDYVWIEARESAKGDLQVSCTTRALALGGRKICANPAEILRQATGPVIFDLPHGKIWYSLKELRAPEYRNMTGLRLEFTYVKGDRVLQVTGIRNARVARALERAGLRKGMIITDINSDTATDLDIWEINRRLAGVYGRALSLKWRTRGGIKTASVSVDLGEAPAPAG